MPAGLLGGLCKGRKEDRDGLRNWEDSCHEGVGGQCVWKSFLVALCHLPVSVGGETIFGFGWIKTMFYYGLGFIIDLICALPLGFHQHRDAYCNIEH